MKWICSKKLFFALLLGVGLLCTWPSYAVEMSYVAIQNINKKGEVTTRHYLKVTVKPYLTRYQSHPHIEQFLNEENAALIKSEYTNRNLLDEEAFNNNKTGRGTQVKTSLDPRTGAIYYFELDSPEIPTDLKKLQGKMVGSIKVSIATAEEPYLPFQKRIRSLKKNNELKEIISVTPKSPNTAQAPLAPATTDHIPNSKRLFKDFDLTPIQTFPEELLKPQLGAVEVTNFVAKHPYMSELLLPFLADTVREMRMANNYELVYAKKPKPMEVIAKNAKQKTEKIKAMIMREPYPILTMEPIYAETAVGARMRYYLEAFGLVPKIAFPDSILTRPGGPTHTVLAVQTDIYGFIQFCAQHRTSAITYVGSAETHSDISLQINKLNQSLKTTTAKGPLNVEVALRSPIVEEFDRGLTPKSTHKNVRPLRNSPPCFSIIKPLMVRVP